MNEEIKRRSPPPQCWKLANILSDFGGNPLSHTLQSEKPRIWRVERSGSVSKSGIYAAYFAPLDSNAWCYNNGHNLPGESKTCSPPSILANNLLSCVRAFVRSTAAFIAHCKKEERKKVNTTAIFLYDLSYRFCTDSFFVIFHFPIYLSIYLSAILIVLQTVSLDTSFFSFFD